VRIPLRTVGADARPFRRAHGPHRDVVVVDVREKFSVERRARRVPSGGRAARAPSASAATASGRTRSAARAPIIGQRAAPVHAVRHERDAASVVGEGERREWQRDRGDRLVSRGADARREPVVIKGRLLFGNRGVNEHERIAALHRFPVPEPGCSLDPQRRVGRIDDERRIALLQRLRPLIVGHRSLRETSRGKKEHERRELPSVDHAGHLWGASLLLLGYFCQAALMAFAMSRKIVPDVGGHFSVLPFAVERSISSFDERSTTDTLSDVSWNPPPTQRSKMSGVTSMAYLVLSTRLSPIFTCPTGSVVRSRFW